jgi:hypothetical protein
MACGTFNKYARAGSFSMHHHEPFCREFTLSACPECGRKGCGHILNTTLLLRNLPFRHGNGAARLRQNQNKTASYRKRTISTHLGASSWLTYRGLFGRSSRTFFCRLALTLNTTHSLRSSNRKFANREDMLDRFTTLHEEISL